MTKIALASDHAGFSLKEKIKHWLVENDYTVHDFGTNSEESVDYPDFASLASKAIAGGGCDFGVFVCGSGIGMCMVANRYKGVRAAVLKTEDDAKLSRQHNNANVACFGARFDSLENVIFLVDIFLNTKFEGGRHDRRVKKIDNQE